MEPRRRSAVLCPIAEHPNGGMAPAKTALMVGRSRRIELRGSVVLFDRRISRHVPNLLERRLDVVRVGDKN